MTDVPAMLARMDPRDTAPAFDAISLGAGVQSTTLALLAAHGLITPMPTAAIFADTGSEPSAVYDHLAWMQSGNVLPFPIVTVRHRLGRTLREELLGAADGSIRNADGSPPFYVTQPDGEQGVARRQCTDDFKVAPIGAHVRTMLGLAPGARTPAETWGRLWLGISTDEAVRIKPSRKPWIVHRWPLIELGMSRHDCEQWLTRNGYPIPPKSACTFCPYRRDSQWRWLRDNDAAGWAEAIEVDEAIRSPGFQALRGMHGALYVHRSRVPLRDVDLSTAEERGQLSAFADECEGHCGV